MREIKINNRFLNKINACDRAREIIEKEFTPRGRQFIGCGQDLKVYEDYMIKNLNYSKRSARKMMLADIYYAGSQYSRKVKDGEKFKPFLRKIEEYYNADVTYQRAIQKAFELLPVKLKREID